MHRKVRHYRLVRCGMSRPGIGTYRGKKAAGAALAGGLCAALLCTAFFLPGLRAQDKVYAAETVSEPETDPSWEREPEAVEEPGSWDGGDTVEETENAADTPRERREILIALDPGHGGDDEGCSRERIYEKEINLAIAKAVESRLLDMDYQVMLTRGNDRKTTLEERVDQANEAGADLYVSIHQNACEEASSSVSGIEVWYNEDREDGSLRLARLVHDFSLLSTGAADRGVMGDNGLYVTRETGMPSCLIETGFLSNREERKLLAEEEYRDKIAEGIAAGIDYYFFPKTMYLTFDDGPSAENTETVLDILKEHDIRATFFLVGENVEKHPEVARRIAEEGHTIGIHCYDHDYQRLYESVDSYVEDFEKARDIVREVTGVETNLFRFPGGSINSYNKKVYRDIVQEMTDRGYIYFDWNASLEDATKHNEPERLLKNAKESTLGRKRVVMLAHDVVFNTTQCLEELLQMFPEYQMLPLTEDVEPVQF